MGNGKKPPIEMVLLHVKRSDKESFLYSVPSDTDVEVVLRDLVVIHNLRQKVNRLADAAQQLAQHGPMKPPEAQGLDDETPLLDDYDVKDGTTKPRTLLQRNENYNPDPTERRNGNAPSSELAAVLTKTVEDARALTSERQVQMKVSATSKELKDAVSNVRGATMICYPMGLPDYDVVRQILEEREDVEGMSAMEQLDGAQASLWCFSKELQRDKKLSEYTGKNEKTKVVAKLQKKGAGAPQREPVVSEDEQKAMIAFYHKKQNEAEAMDRVDEDAYLHSSWANPKALKNAFTGVGDVSWKGVR